MPLATHRVGTVLGHSLACYLQVASESEYLSVEALQVARTAELHLCFEEVCAAPFVSHSCAVHFSGIPWTCAWHA